MGNNSFHIKGVGKVSWDGVEFCSAAQQNPEKT